MRELFPENANEVVACDGTLGFLQFLRKREVEKRGMLFYSYFVKERGCCGAPAILSERKYSCVKVQFFACVFGTGLG